MYNTTKELKLPLPVTQRWKHSTKVTLNSHRFGGYRETSCCQDDVSHLQSIVSESECKIIKLGEMQG